MATFSEHFRYMIEHAPDTFKHEPVRDTRPRCAMCGTSHADLNKNELCPACQIDKDRGYTVSTKAGRCANGAERDHGALFHARMLNEYGAEWVPVCGKAPGKRSGGWSEWRPQADQPVTCPQCLKKLERI